MRIPIETTLFLNNEEELKTMENIEENLTLAKRLISVIEGKMNYYSDLYDFGSVNLKLYDVSFHLGEMIEKYFPSYDGEEYEVFNDYCELEYHYVFLEYLKENRLKTNHIGRTSSFYFELENDGYTTELLDTIEDSNIQNERITWEDVVSEYDYLYVLSDIDSETTASKVVKKYIEEHSNMNDFNLEYVLDNVKDGAEELIDILMNTKDDLDIFVEQAEKIKSAYDWLEEYKKHQLDNFKSYLVCREESEKN